VGDTFIPLLLFAVIGSFTPGPNNLMVTASGTLFGFRRTVPHILGVLFGFSGMVVAFGLGLGQIFQAYPIIHQWLRIAGAIYLLYLAWRIASAGSLSGDETVKRPLTFLEAALFQFLNPKAWTLALGVIAAFTTPGGSVVAELAVILAVFAVTTIATLCVWCLFGVAIRRFLSSPRALRITNLVMAATVALSVVMLFI
jgi:threonine/homoserine/homoserine lactone efflux protein